MTSKAEEIISTYYKEIELNTPLKEIFRKVLVKYLEFHNSATDVISEGDDTLFCSIHRYFTDGHNCIGCNLNESNRRIERFLLGYRFFGDEYSVFTTFIFLLYLQAEQIFEYFDIIKLPEQYKHKHFYVLFDIKRWANFLKHPKTFSLVHHPSWTYKSEEVFHSNGNSPVIDTAFVNKYYSGDKNNNELSRKLGNKQELEVIFPNPLTLIERFCEAQKKFVLLIKENQIIRDILDDKASIRDYYDSLSDDKVQDGDT